MSACPSPEELRRFVDEPPDAADLTALGEHLEVCASCREFLDRSHNDPDSRRWRDLRARDPADHEPTADVLLRLEQAVLRSWPARTVAAPTVDTAGFTPTGYEVLHEIGRGGIGVVYKASHRNLNRIVALKVLLAGRHAGPEDRSRFQAEAQAVARLQHPAIVQIYEVGESQDRPFLALEFVEGPSLAWQLRGQPQPPPVAAELVETLARAVAFAHAHGVVHRDLKPSNVLLQPIARQQSGPDESKTLADFRPKITDFGLAKLLDQPDRTETGRILGTPGYMAPEQARGQSKVVGPAADIYALGAILYELLTGRPPFQGVTPVDTVIQVLHHEPVPPRRLQPKLPRDLETICLKCLHKNPAARYPSAAALADDLRRFLDGRAVLARRVGPVGRLGRLCRRNPALAALGVGLLLAVAAAFTGVTWGYVSAESARRHELAARMNEARQRDQAELALYYSRIALAEREWLANNVARADSLLDRCRPVGEAPDRRGFEWYYLKRLCRSELLTISAHPGLHVRGVLFTPDGQHLLTAAGRPDYARLGVEQGGLARWTTSGRSLGSLDGLPTQVMSLTQSRDGSRLLTLGSEQKASLWDLSSWRLLATYDAVSTDGITARAAISPDGRKVAIPTNQGVELRLAGDGQLLDRLGGNRPVTWVVFHPTGNYLATAERSGTVRLWDVTHHRQLWQLAAKPNALAFSTDGAQLAIADQDTIRICESETGRECGRLRGHNGTVRSLDWLPGSHHLATTSNDQTVRLWDADTGRELRVYRGHTAPVLCVACSPDGRHLASGDAAGLVKVWDTAQDQRAAVLAETPEAAALCFDPTGQQLRVAKVSGGKFGGVRTFDLGSGTVMADHTLDLVRRVEWPLRYVDFSPDGHRLAGPTGSDPKSVGLWDATTGQLLTTARGHGVEVRVVTFSPNGRHLATAAWNRQPNSGGELALWESDDPGRAAPVWLASTPSPVDCLAFSPEGRYLVAGDRGDPPAVPGRPVDGRLVVWDTQTRQPLRAWSAHAGRVQAVAVSPDEKTVVSVGREPGSGLRIWDADSGRLRHDLPAPLRATVVRFSPDGTRLAVAGYEGTVQLWDPLTGQDILTLRGPVGQITESEANDTDIAFSPDGTRLAVNCWTKAIHVFRAEPTGPDSLQK